MGSAGQVLHGESLGQEGGLESSSAQDASSFSSFFSQSV